MSKFLTTTSEAIPTPPISKEPISQQESLNGWIVFSRIARLPLLPALLMPILWGTALVWWETSSFSGWLFTLLLLVWGMLGVGLNLLGHYYDYRRSLVYVAPENEATRPPGVVDTYLPMDGYRCLVEGYVRPGAIRSLAYITFFIALFGIIWLGAISGWPLWFFGGASCLLICIYLAPPLRYGRRWWIFDDVGLLFALGYLPALSAAYAQSQMLSQAAVIGAFTPALLTWLAFQSYNLYSWHRDWKLRKRTAVVTLLPPRAVDVATGLGLLAFVATILMVALGELPVWSLLVLGALPTFLHAFARGHHQIIPRTEARQASSLAVSAAVLAGLLSIVALWIAG
jgi:1,4-dihydroxy-2-naphthoate octaprenyltransferase